MLVTQIISPGLMDFPILQFAVKLLQLAGENSTADFLRILFWHSVYNLTIEGEFASLKARVDNRYVYAGEAEGFAGIILIRSSDKGNAWENLFPLCNVQDLDFYGQTNHKIIVTDGFKIKLSTNSGANWTQIFQSDSLLIQNISFSADRQRTFVVTNTLFYALPRTYFFVSSDSGFTWNILQLIQFMI